MAIVDSLHGINTDAYWDDVKAAYRDIIHLGHTFPVDILRVQIAQRPEEEQLLLYHREPLAVAADIAGITLDDSIIQSYLAGVAARRKPPRP